jgi:hypothetical protein
MLSDFAVCRPGLRRAGLRMTNRPLDEGVLTSESGNQQARDCDTECKEWNCHAHAAISPPVNASGDQSYASGPEDDESNRRRPSNLSLIKRSVERNKNEKKNADLW